jgi:aminoglycoside 3-N-acetyltransferase
MQQPTTTSASFQAHLSQLGIRRGDKLTVHSQLLSFGFITGGLQTVLDCLLAAVGAQGTIIVPAYSYAKGTVFHRAITPSFNVGAFSEFVRQQPGAVRSRNPMFSHAALGRDAAMLEGPDGHYAVGPGSDFDLFHSQDCRLLLLGTSIGGGAAFGHHIEALADVPYREWLDLDREVMDDQGAVHPFKCRYYGRRDFEGERQLRDNFFTLEAPMADRGLMTTVPTLFGASSLCRLADLAELGLEMLAADPYAVVAQR